MKNASREKQLNVIAYNLGHRAERKNFAYLDNQIPNRVRWLSHNSEGADKVVSSFLFTRNEVEEHQAKLQNKPDWDDIPEQACIMVQNGNGTFTFGTFKNATPSFSIESWMGEGPGEWLGHLDGNLIGDWTDSLEHRPIPEDQPTPEEEEAFKAMEEQQNHNADWYKKTLPPVGTKCIFTTNKVTCYIVAHHICGERAIWCEDLKVGTLKYGRKHDFEPITDKTLWCDEVAQRTGLHFERESLEAIFEAGLGFLPEDY